MIRLKKKISFLLLSLALFLFAGCGGSKKETDKSLQLNKPHNVRGVISYKNSFNDLNEDQLKAARVLGIRPLTTRAQAMCMSRFMAHLINNQFYEVDELKHSMPYLVPKAATLLAEIGKVFLDSLESKGLNPNKIVVTSVLRTHEDVKTLNKRNLNASENSAHAYGTTFDVSWKRFKKLETVSGRPMESVDRETLKLVLSEVLRDFKKRGRCFVKYERKQGCFHITYKGMTS